MWTGMRFGFRRVQQRRWIMAFCVGKSSESCFFHCVSLSFKLGVWKIPLSLSLQLPPMLADTYSSTITLRVIPTGMAELEWRSLLEIIKGVGVGYLQCHLRLDSGKSCDDWPPWEKVTCGTRSNLQSLVQNVCHTWKFHTNYMFIECENYWRILIECLARWVAQKKCTSGHKWCLDWRSTLRQFVLVFNNLAMSGDIPYPSLIWAS